MQNVKVNCSETKTSQGGGFGAEAPVNPQKIVKLVHFELLETISLV